MQNRIILTTLAGKQLYIDKTQIYAVYDKSSHSEIFAGAQCFYVSETPEMIFGLCDGAW